MAAYEKGIAARRDRQANWMVVGIAVLALVLGWLVKSTAENRTTTYDSGGFSARYPSGWVDSTVSTPVIMRFEDPWAIPSRTVLLLARHPLAPNIANPLSALQQTLSLERGTSWTAYRVLDVREDVSIGARVGTQVSFAFVETRPNPFLSTLPVVVRGQDYIFAQGDQALVSTLLAAEDDYERSEDVLIDFVRSLGVPE